MTPAPAAANSPHGFDTTIRARPYAGNTTEVIRSTLRSFATPYAWPTSWIHQTGARTYGYRECDEYGTPRRAVSPVSATARESCAISSSSLFSQIVTCPEASQ